MGRRALRKIDPTLDLSPWLIPEADLPERLTVETLFGRARPLEIEVGTGKGMFLSRATEMRPGHDFLGIEISHKYARFAAARLATLERDNAKVIHGDGVRIFQQRLVDESAVAVHVYFPDPWWKQRHRKRRLMNGPFLRDVQRVLCPGASLHFWTDVKDYYDASVELIREVVDLKGPFVPDQQPAEHDLDYRTHFERRVRLHDQPVYRAEFRK